MCSYLLRTWNRVRGYPSNCNRVPGSWNGQYCNSLIRTALQCGCAFMYIQLLMSSMLYLLSLCVVTVTQLTSSQSTWDTDQQENARTEQALNLLMRMNSQLMNAVSQLQKDVAELRTGTRQKDARGKGPWTWSNDITLKWSFYDHPTLYTLTLYNGIPTPPPNYITPTLTPSPR